MASPGVNSLLLQPSYNPVPLEDTRCCITRVIHQLIFLIDYFLYKVRGWCSCICGAAPVAYQTSSLNDFRSLGGRVEAVRRFDLDRVAVDGQPVVISRDETVYPVCVAGRNRSQMTKHVLERKGVDAERMARPHGALLAMDVLDEYDDHEMVTWFGTMGLFACQEELGRFGNLMRVPRVGEEETANLDKYQRRAWMDEHYFLKIIRERSVVITYKESFAPMVTRLVEVARRYGLGLENVRIVPINSEDPLFSCQVPQFVNCLDQVFSVSSTPVQGVHNARSY